jgi:hypothetical protein
MDFTKAIEINPKYMTLTYGARLISPKRGTTIGQMKNIEPL